LLHAAAEHTQVGTDIRPLPFAVLGYTVFIVFRGVVNRSEGALEANAPLLYHRSVTIADIVVSRALLELAGTFLTYVVLMSLIVGIGFAQLPARPLYLLAAWALILWYAVAQGMIITMGTYESRTLGRLVHTYSYFMVGLSGAFYQMAWIPHPYREWVQWIPLTSVFELARYGQFEDTKLDYFHGQYLIGACLFQTWLGLLMVKLMRHRIHLA
jgi:capsular polysaccharide transport system permease protein